MQVRENNNKPKANLERRKCWTTERGGGGESVVTVLKQLCFFLKLFAEILNDDHNNTGK
jgi:hypothetical protein